MKLSDVIRGMDGTLLSDGEFRSIAFATEETQSGFLTFLEKAKFLPALNNPGISCVLIKPEPRPIFMVFLSAMPPKRRFLPFTTRCRRTRPMSGRLFPHASGKIAISARLPSFRNKTSSSATMLQSSPLW